MRNLNKTIKIVIYWLSYILIVPPPLLAILLPQPYGDGKVSDVFGTNTLALIFFLGLMIAIMCCGLLLRQLCYTITFDKVKSQISDWSREQDLSTLHSVLPKFTEIVNESEVLDVKEAKRKQKEFVSQLANAWKIEKNLNSESDERVAQLLEELEKVKNENKSLQKFKKEKAKLDKMIKAELEAH